MRVHLVNIGQFSTLHTILDYNTLAADYARYRTAHPGILRCLISVPALNATSRALEVGCGTGNYIIRLQELTGCIASGIDSSEQMLAKARERNSAVAFKLARAESISEPDAAYDLVFTVDVIHHVTDRAAYWRDALRVLRPGGLVCTATDSEWIIRNRPMSHYFPETVEPELHRYPDIPILHEEMSAAGFIAQTEENVEYTYDLTDASVYQAKAYSALHLITADAHAQGMERMERDLRIAPVRCVSRYVLLWGMRSG